MSETTDSAPGRRAVRRRARGRAAAVVGAVVLMGAMAVVAVGLGGRRPEAPSAANLPAGTAQVTRETMQDTNEVAGDLGYGTPIGLPGRIPGTVTEVPLAGDVITRGQPLYRVDNDPIVLMYGDVVAYRPLSTGTRGPDVRQLEANLRALGYVGFTVDDRFTASTRTAVRRWQKDLGITQTSRVEPGRVLFAAGPVRVDSVTASVNGATGDGQDVLRYTGTTRRVTVRLDVADQRLARKGADVQIRLPDGKQVPGRIDRVYTVIQPANTPDGQPETKVETLVALNDPRAAVGVEAAVVNVVFTAAEREDVLTVPIAALVALAEGGYGVEAIEGGTTRYVRVETGLFAAGRVEISGDGLSAGMTVGMPA
ncbi:peptidoglycan-binding domain-containing protein [Micromonospora sp. NPDC005215]|uniref:peptidoglycan-binding domain-containing protein n=1 Tax=Micromonospora sp. NPDC005215 TaxID=3157024 RepID=UPI0033A14887